MRAAVIVIALWHVYAVRRFIVEGATAQRAAAVKTPPDRKLVFRSPMSPEGPRFAPHFPAGGFLSFSDGDEFDRPRNEEPEIITAPPSIIQMVVKASLGKEEESRESQSAAMTPKTVVNLVTESSDTNPFPSIRKSMATSRFKMPMLVDEEIPPDSEVQDRIGPLTDFHSQPGKSAQAPASSTVVTEKDPSDDNPRGDLGTRKGIWRKRIRNPTRPLRTGLTPRPKVSSRSFPPSGKATAANIVHRVTSTPLPGMRRQFVSRPPRPHAIISRPWPPLGAEDKEVVKMATLEIPKLTGERIGSSAESISSTDSTSAPQTMTQKTRSTVDGMATGSEQEELWVTPRVEIRSSSRPYHEIVSPGVAGHFWLPPPAAKPDSDDFDGFYGEPVPSEVIFENAGSRETDSSSDTQSTHPPYVFNEGYTSPRPLGADEVVSRRSTANTQQPTFTYPGFLPTTERARTGDQQDVVDVDGEHAQQGQQPAVKRVEAGVVRDVVLDTEQLAYILIGTCCALSVVCLVVVVISMRCRKLCHSGAGGTKAEVHHAKYVDWEDGVLESHVSVRSSSLTEATTHRLGTWFNGRTGMHGNMALPMGFKSAANTRNSKRGAYYVDGKTSSTRDLVSIASENSGRQRRRRTTAGYRVDLNSSSPPSSRASSESASDDSLKRGAEPNEEQASESVHLCPAGPDEDDRVEIVNFRKLPSPHFPPATGVQGVDGPAAWEPSDEPDNPTSLDNETSTQEQQQQAQGNDSKETIYWSTNDERLI